MALPTAEREMPSASAASVKVPARAVVTKVTRPFKDSTGSICSLHWGHNVPPRGKSKLFMCLDVNSILCAWRHARPPPH